jgi:hypothetical protein
MLFSYPVMPVHFMAGMPFMVRFFMMGRLRVYSAEAERS